MGTQAVLEKGKVQRVVFEPMTIRTAHQQRLRYVYLAKISLTIETITANTQQKTHSYLHLWPHIRHLQ